MSSDLILVNGAGGFLGSHVVELLCARGQPVRATDRPGCDLEPARRAEAEVMAADLLDRDALPRLFDGVGKVVNVAGLFNYSLPVDVLNRANVEVTRNMCAAALTAGVSRFVHIASIAVYGRPRSVPMREDHPRNAANNYERSKKAGEDAVFESVKRGLPAASLRPAGIYGPRSRYGQAAFMAMLALYRLTGRRKLPVMSGGPRMQHVHVTDVAGAALAALTAAEDRVAGKAFNVGDDTPITQGELFRAIMPGLDLTPAFSYPYFTRAYWPFIRALLALPESVFEGINARFQKAWQARTEPLGLIPALAPRLDRDFLGYMNGDYELDNAALKAIGWTPRFPDARQGLAETVRWYQEMRWLPRF